MRLPKKVGHVAVRVEGNKVLIHYNGNPFAWLDGVAIADWGGAPAILRPYTTTVSAGSQWRRWLGDGSVITREYEGVGRRIVETLSVHATGLNIDHEVTYLADADVYEHAVRLRLLCPRPSDINITTNGVAAELRMGIGSLDILLESGRHTPNFVFAPDGAQLRSDYNTRAQGAVHKVSASIGPSPTPVILPTRHGRQGVVMWSIHADRQTTEVTRALCFGASDPSHPYYGVRGFLSRGLPYTQSVFAVSWTEEVHGIRSDGLDKPDYKALIDELYAAGCDVCPHTTEHGPEDRQAAIERLPAYTPYQATNWIDHSLGDGVRSIGLKSEGWNPEAPNYIMDLLDQYGYKYAWSYYDYHVIQELRGLQMAKPYVRGSLPHELLYQNTNLRLASGEPIWQWPAWRVDIGRLFDRLTTDAIDELIANRGVTNIHEYFVPTQEGTLFEIDGDTVVISEALDGILQYMQQQYDAGRLWHPTVKEWAERVVRLYQVAVRRAQDGFLISNNSGSTIDGFTLFIPDYYGSARLNGTPMNRKGTPDGVILWASLPVGESKLLL